jgi:hypothetical protein
MAGRLRLQYPCLFAERNRKGPPLGDGPFERSAPTQAFLKAYIFAVVICFPAFARLHYINAGLQERFHSRAAIDADRNTGLMVKVMPAGADPPLRL